MLDSPDIPVKKGLSCPVCRHQGMDNVCVKTKEPNNTTPTMKTSEVFSYTPIEEDSAGINDLNLSPLILCGNLGLPNCSFGNSSILVLHT